MHGTKRKGTLLMFDGLSVHKNEKKMAKSNALLIRKEGRRKKESVILRQNPELFFFYFIFALVTCPIRLNPISLILPHTWTLPSDRNNSISVNTLLVYSCIEYTYSCSLVSSTGEDSIPVCISLFLTSS